MAKILDVGVIKKSCDHQNGEEISPGNLCRGGLFNPIEMDIFTKLDKKHRIRVRGSGKDSSGKKSASSFIRKIEISPIHCRNLK